MPHFNYKERNLLSGPHLFGSLLILSGVFALVSPAIITSGSSLERVISVGIGAVIFGLLIISSYGGTRIDFSAKRFKEYASIAGYKKGEWKTLPDILQIKVSAKSSLRTNTPNGVSPTLSGKVTRFHVLLYSNDAKPVFTFAYPTKSKAVKQAKLLASNLAAQLISEGSNSK